MISWKCICVIGSLISFFTGEHVHDKDLRQGKYRFDIRAAG